MESSNEDALLDAAKDLVAIKSTADNPAGLQAVYEYMRDFIEASGKGITIEEFESIGKLSLLAYYGEERPERFRILLNAHLDVVPGEPEQFEPYVQDGNLYGRGTHDMKAAAIVLAQVFCEYVDTVPYALGLQIVTDEESAGEHGTKHQIEQGVRADFILCGECGRAAGTYEIANEAKGVAAFEVQFDGDSVHAAYPWRGENAALRAAEFVRKLHQQFPESRHATGETTATVTGISAGGAVYNQTPASATVRVDCRYAPDDERFKDPDTVTSLVHNIDPGASIAQFLTYGPPMRTSPTNPLLLDLKAAAEEVEGREFTFVRRNGSSDGRFYAEAGGEACEFGIAGEHQHADGEYITLEALKNYLHTMRAYLHKTAASEVARPSTATVPQDE